MQISRLFEIVYILLDKRRVTARELAEKFEVSTRTIYRDIDALCQAGVPIYATQGAGGGIHISDAYVLNKSTLSDTEQMQILLALRSLPSSGDQQEVDNLLSRLGYLFRKDAADWIEVDFSRWGSSRHDKETLATIKEAVLKQHPLTFLYHSIKSEQTERSVYPFKLIYKTHAWYLQAYCLHRKAFRTFKLARMTSITALDETFDRAKLPSPPPLEAEESQQPTVAFSLITLSFDSHIAWRVYDEFDVSMIQTEEGGKLTVRVPFPIDSWLLGYILSYGAAVEVLCPLSLRNTICALLCDIQQKYTDK